MQHDDRLRVQHMLDACKEALSFAHGRSRSDLYQDRQLLYALVRCIEIVGEAASQVSGDARREAPEVPWSSIVAMRNRLIHAYFDIDHELVWRTVQDEIPVLVAQLEKLFNKPP